MFLETCSVVCSWKHAHLYALGNMHTCVHAKQDMVMNCIHANEAFFWETQVLLEVHVYSKRSMHDS
jgi:hypothetical protein